MSNLRKCKTCYEPVARRAKICPHCGQKKPGKRILAMNISNSSTSGRILLGILGFILLCLCVIIL